MVKHIPLSNSIGIGQRIQEGEGQGISTTLQNLARTEEFLIPEMGTIEYYGEISSYRSPCDESVIPPQPGEGPNRPVLGWGIVDTTEFAVELVDANTHQVLAVLGTVGVLPPLSTTTTAVDTRYGSECTRAVHAYALPAEHAGTTVYLRVSPRRRGLTPEGLLLSKHREWISLSSLYASDGTSISQDSIYALSDTFFQKTIAYCDSVKAATGAVPDQEDEINKAWDIARSTTFMNRYYDAHTDAQGRTTHYTPKGTASNKAAVQMSVKSNQAARIIRGGNPSVHFSVHQNTVQGQSLTVELQGSLVEYVSIHLISLSGKDIGKLWSGNIAPSPQDINLTLPAGLASGKYILTLIGDNNHRLGTTQIVLGR